MKATQRIGIIDCGTNTFNLIVADIGTRGLYQIFCEAKIAVKLGAGGIWMKTILSDAMERGAHAINRLVAVAHENACTAILAFGTSAFRRAENKQDFVSFLKERTGITVKIISGTTEAFLIAKGVTQTTAQLDGSILILDIGGGSCEFIICNGKEILWAESYDLGAALLLDKFKPHDPMLHEEITEIETYINKKTANIHSALSGTKPLIMVGAAGAFETFSDVLDLKFRKQKSSDTELCYPLSLNEYTLLHQLLITSTITQKKKMEGMWEERADMIAIASIITTFALRKFSINQLWVSRYSLREGILLQLSSGYHIQDLSKT